MRRKYFKEGDRTNFTFYDSIESYQIQNPNVNPIYSAFIKSAIHRNGFVVKIESVTSESGRNISHLVSGMPQLNYVFGPSFRLRETSRDMEMGRVVAKFIRECEAAHEATKNSKLVFKAN